MTTPTAMSGGRLGDGGSLDVMNELLYAAKTLGKVVICWYGPRLLMIVSSRPHSVIRVPRD